MRFMWGWVTQNLVSRARASGLRKDFARVSLAKQAEKLAWSRLWRVVARLARETCVAGLPELASLDARRWEVSRLRQLRQLDSARAAQLEARKARKRASGPALDAK